MSEQNAPVGFAIDFAKPIRPMGTGSLGIVGEVGHNRFHDDLFDETLGQTTFMGGVRFSGPSSATQMFGQILAGAIKGGGTDFSDGYTDFGIQPGVGLKLSGGENFDFKVQLDFPIDFYDGGNSKGLRLNFGVVFNLGQ
jgi:hypothetical protein